MFYGKKTPTFYDQVLKNWHFELLKLCVIWLTCQIMTWHSGDSKKNQTFPLHCCCRLKTCSSCLKSKTYFCTKQDKRKTITALTDIIVAFSLTKLLPKCEWSKTLELFGELLWSVRSKWMAALPAHLVVWLGLAGHIIFTLHHVQHIPLGVHLRHLAQRVVRANNVQVVIELHLHGIVVPLKPAEGERKGEEGYASGRRLITIVIAQEGW